jgi:membrane fusion protein, multidrug efflux system
MRRIKFLIAMFAAAGWSQTAADFVPVVSRQVARTVDLPGELLPFQSVTLHAKMAGFVEQVLVDRGSVVKKGDLLVELSAPELRAQLAGTESKVQAAEAERAQADAQLAGAQSTLDRLRKAAETPGAVAGNELVLADKQVEAATALVAARRQASRAAQSAVDAQKDLEQYLRITAPFEGVVTERLAHPGALAGAGVNAPLLIIQQVSQLRLVVSVPEPYSGAIANGAAVTFHVPAYPERTFSGAVARVSHVLDPKTRTMPVEVDVANRDGALSPGMYPSVKWPVRATHAALWAPRTSVVTTTERTFVIRERDGRAEWVDVRKGAADGDLIEVMGNLKAGDRVLRRGTDEVREGAAIGR